MQKIIAQYVQSEYLINCEYITLKGGVLGMSLKDTYKHMRDLLCNITADLEKSENGNKAASQRVRTGTVKLEKIAKMFRKESISSEKKHRGQKKPAKAAHHKKPSAKSKHAHHGASSKAKSASHSKAIKARPKAKSVRSRQFSLKHSSAKLRAGLR